MKNCNSRIVSAKYILQNSEVTKSSHEKYFTSETPNAVSFLFNTQKLPNLCVLVSFTLNNHIKLNNPGIFFHNSKTCFGMKSFMLVRCLSTIDIWRRSRTLFGSSVTLRQESKRLDCYGY